MGLLKGVHPMHKQIGEVITGAAPLWLTPVKHESHAVNH